MRSKALAETSRLAPVLLKTEPCKESYKILKLMTGSLNSNISSVINYYVNQDFAGQRENTPLFLEKTRKLGTKRRN